MSISISRNASANVLGKAWSTILNLAILPIYARLLGYEAYGLVGFYASLQTVLTILDLGLAPTLARSLSELSVSKVPGARSDIRPLVRTFGLLFLILGLLAGIVVAGTSHFTARWVQAHSLEQVTVERSIALMGAVFASQWPGGLFVGGLMALEKQVAANVAVSGGVGIRALTTLLVLRFVANTPEAFFLCQAATAAIQTLVTYLLLENAIPRGPSSKLGLHLIGSRWRFAGGTAIIALFAIIIVQADKVILSRTLSLADFGRYALASAAASVVGILVSPIIQAVYPRLVMLVTEGSRASLVETYHATSRWTAAVVFPISVTLVSIPTTVLFAWSADAGLAASSGLTLALLSTAATMNALMNGPYYLQLAHGWTRLQATANGVLSIVLVPALLASSRKWGAVGAAGACAATNVIFALVTVSLVHRRVLVGQARRWYWNDSARPFAGACAGALLTRLLPFPGSRVAALGKVGVVLLASALGVLLASSELRTDVARGYHWLMSRRA